jgi:predicted transcriptional regulator
LAVEEKVKAIRIRYDEVEKDLKNCKQVKRAVMDESAEGGELTAYFSGQSLRKLVGIFYGETGKTLEEYYFWDERLFFVLRVDSHYDKPLSGVTTRKSEERFYFADDALIRWLDSEKKEVSAGSAFQERGRQYVELTRRFSDLARKEDADPR